MIRQAGLGLVDDACRVMGRPAFGQIMPGGSKQWLRGSKRAAARLVIRTIAGLPLVIVASSLGTVIEWYDFYVFGSLTTVLSFKF